jgi:hypothetical protein
MKSQKAKEAIERYRQAFSAPYQADETAEYCRLFKEIAEIAEQEAEERMREKAIEAFCAANCPKGCSFGADGNIGCGAKARFIQKQNEE